jgi:hypothetical protein
VVSFLLMLQPSVLMNSIRLNSLRSSSNPITSFPSLPSLFFDRFMNFKLLLPYNTFASFATPVMSERDFSLHSPEGRVNEQIQRTDSTDRLNGQIQWTDSTIRFEGQLKISIPSFSNISAHLQEERFTLVKLLFNSRRSVTCCIPGHCKV